PFAQPPVDGPPPPQFELPEAEAEIPRFDEFVSPFTADLAPVLGPAPSTGSPPSLVTEPPGENSSRSSGSPDAPPDLSTAAAEASLFTEGMTAGAGTGGPAPSDPVQPPTTLQPEEAALAAAPDETPEASGVWDGEDVEGEAGQLRWRSPFRLPGP